MRYYEGQEIIVLDKDKVYDIIKRNFGKPVTVFCRENLNKHECYLSNIFSQRQSGGQWGTIPLFVAQWLAMKLHVDVEDIRKEKPATPVGDSERRENAETDMSKLSDKINKLDQRLTELYVIWALYFHQRNLED